MRLAIACVFVVPLVLGCGQSHAPVTVFEEPKPKEVVVQSTAKNLDETPSEKPYFNVSEKEVLGAMSAMVFANAPQFKGITDDWRFYTWVFQPVTLGFQTTKEGNLIAVEMFAPVDWIITPDGLSDAGFKVRWICQFFNVIVGECDKTMLSMMPEAQHKLERLVNNEHPSPTRISDHAALYVYRPKPVKGESYVCIKLVADGGLKDKK